MLTDNFALRVRGICETDAESSPVDAEIFRGPPRVGNGKDEPAELPDDSKALIRAVLQTLPIEHRRSQIVLRGIFRNKRTGYYPAQYRPAARVIEIAHPLKMGRLYRSLSVGTADSAFCKLESAMSGKDASKWPEGRSASDSSFFLRNVQARAGAGENFYQYAFLHEFGHSIDHLIDFTGQFLGTAPFGAWIAYKFGRLEHMIYDMLGELGAPELATLWDAYYRPVFEPALAILEAKSHATERPRHYCKSWRDARQLTRSGAGRPGLSGAAIEAAIVARLDGRDHAVLFPYEARRAFTKCVLDVHAVLDVATTDPHLQSVGAGDTGPRNLVGTRRFQFMSMYGEWYSYLDAAYQRRVSNYQFAAPGEWFPEAYASLFGPDRRQQHFWTVDREGAEWLHGCLCKANFAGAGRGAGLLRRGGAGVRLEPRMTGANLTNPTQIFSDLRESAHRDVTPVRTTDAWEAKWKREVLEKLRPGDVIMAYGFNLVGFGQGVAKFLKRVTVVPWLVGTGLRAAAGGGTLGNKGTVNANHAMIVLGEREEIVLEEDAAGNKTETPESVARRTNMLCSRLAHATNAGVHKSDIVDVFKANYDTLRVFRRKPVHFIVEYRAQATVTTIKRVLNPRTGRVAPVGSTSTDDSPKRVPLPVGAAITAAAWSRDAAPAEGAGVNANEGMGYASAKAVRSGLSISAYLTGGSAEAYHRYKLERGGPPLTSIFASFGEQRKKRMFCSMFVIACYHAAGEDRDQRLKYLPLDASATTPEMLDTYLKNSPDWETVLTASSAVVE